MNCSECGKDHSVLPALWPVGSMVENTNPLHYHTGNGNEVGKMPIGTMGRVMFHTNDGRPGIEFSGYPNVHTFHHPEDALRLVEMPPVDLQAEVERLRTANAELVAACKALIKAFWGDTDTDVLEQGEVVSRAKRTIAESEAENGQR